MVQVAEQMMVVAVPAKQEVVSMEIVSQGYVNVQLTVLE
jgi:hypothetical protein